MAELSAHHQILKEIDVFEEKLQEDYGPISGKYRRSRRSTTLSIEDLEDPPH